MAVFQNKRAWATPTRLLVMSFLSFILIGTIYANVSLVYLCPCFSWFHRCTFTATSAVCVTGLVVFNTASYWSIWGKVVILVLIQAGGSGL